MRPEKQLLLSEIQGKANESEAFFFIRYQHLSPNLSSSLRLQLATKGSDIEVVRKRILLKALQEVGFPISAELLEGHIAVIFAQTDPIEVAKLIYRFREAHEGILEVLGGQFEKRFCKGQNVEQISKLPSVDEMRAQMLALLEAPLTGFLGVANSLLTSVMFCLEDRAQKDS